MTLRLVHDADAPQQPTPPATVEPGEDVFDGAVELAESLADRLHDLGLPIGDEAIELCELLWALRESYKNRTFALRWLSSGLSILPELDSQQIAFLREVAEEALRK